MTTTDGDAVINRRGIASVGVASIVAALAGYLVLVIVARTVSPQVNADFLVFWSLFFGGYGLLGGLQQEATRAVGARMLESRERTGPEGTRVLPWFLLIGVVTAALAALTAPAWFPRLLAGQPGAIVLILCVATVVLAGHVTLGGLLAGRRLWSLSAVLTGGESALRLVAVAVVAFFGAGVVGLEVATVVSSAFWLVMLVCSRSVRRAAGARSADRPDQMVGRAGQAMLAAAGSAALVVGYPTLMRLSATGSEWASAAPLVLAISLTRAPLLMPLSAYQGVAISYFLDPRHGRFAALARIVLGILGVGSVGAVLAWFVGPWLLVTFFGPGYRESGMLLAALTLAAVALAVLTITGASVLALGMHRAYALGWVLAFAVSAGVLFVPLPLAERAVLSLAIGPAIGACLHVVSLAVTRKLEPTRDS